MKIAWSTNVFAFRWKFRIEFDQLLRAAGSYNCSTDTRATGRSLSLLIVLRKYTDQRCDF